MKLEIVNDKKLNWNYVKKIMFKITSDTLSYEEPLRLDDIIRIHFITGNIITDYYSQEKK